MWLQQTTATPLLADLAFLNTFLTTYLLPADCSRDERGKGHLTEAIITKLDIAWLSETVTYTVSGITFGD